jgi:hypothetical protein
MHPAVTTARAHDAWPNSYLTMFAIRGRAEDICSPQAFLNLTLSGHFGGPALRDPSSNQANFWICPMELQCFRFEMRNVESSRHKNSKTSSGSEARQVNARLAVAIHAARRVSDLSLTAIGRTNCCRDLNNSRSILIQMYCPTSKPIASERPLGSGRLT